MPRRAPIECSKPGSVTTVSKSHQGGDVAAHAVFPGIAVRVDLGGVGDGVAVDVQVGGYRGEGGEVEAG